MLVQGSKLIGVPVMSIHVGGEVARTKDAVIDPEKLHLIAYEVDGPLLRGVKERIMLTDDVREYGRIGFIVDSRDEFVMQEDALAVDKIRGLNFSLVGLRVVTKKGKKLGKVSDYMVNTENFMVEKIIVQRPIVKSIMDPELVIDRSEIVEIDDYKLTVKDEEAKLKAKEKKEAANFVPNFVNPFREPAFETIHNQNPDGPEKQ